MKTLKAGRKSRLFSCLISYSTQTLISNDKDSKVNSIHNSVKNVATISSSMLNKYRRKILHIARNHELIKQIGRIS